MGVCNPLGEWIARERFQRSLFNLNVGLTYLKVLNHKNQSNYLWYNLIIRIIQEITNFVC
jgi:hypothetical protein